MQRNIPRKIHIIGSVASGKTTLAKELSTKLGVPYYELDNVAWERNPGADRRRTDLEKRNYLNTIVRSESWIIEGVHNEEWVSGSFQHADLIIFLDINYFTRTYRIIKRYIFQKAGMEHANYQPTLKIFLKMFKWNKQFEERGKPNFFKSFGKYRDKTIVVCNIKELKNQFS
ncbi:AAA family ATPase [Halobacillus litoralis]|uniref:AAA family ATPase n=1 Tax=Halobacillus litoralis TaxID=45668 RepID=UPI002490DD08|nr:AAA family ATPase [Halobacillus litoralis]